MKHILFFLLGVGFISISSTQAQSIHGNIAEFRESNSLDFANVEIFKNDELIASLITDKNGNYDIALDTGTYVVNIMYSGYETLIKEIVVRGDEKADYKLKDDPKAKKRKRELLKDLVKEDHAKSIVIAEDAISLDDIEYSLEDRYYSPEPIEMSMASKPVAKGLYADGYFSISETESVNQHPHLKGLTAGEINDFSKWKLWQDLTTNDLAYFQNTWKFSPKGRYTVQLMNKEKIPLVDAVVKLLDDQDQIIWSSKTDNTGKAELWETIQFPLDSLRPTAKKIHVEYRGITKTIRKAKPFNKGLNTLVLDADCEASYAVDIAFVVDATGSMQDEIDYLKLEINDVIYQAKQMNDQLTMRFGNVFYRDHGDQYVTKHQDFTKVLSSSSAFIEEQFADGGGDGPEAVEDALSVAIDTLSWSEDARARILFLVLDAPSHNNSKIQRKLKALSQKAAAKGIRIVPITGSGIDKSAEYLMRSISLTSNGSYVFLTDHSGIGGGHIAPSTDEYEVQLLNELLQNLIKSYIYVPDCEETIPEIDLLPELSDSLVSYSAPKDSIDISLPDVGEVSDSTDITPPIDPFINVSWSFYPNPTYGPLTIEVSEAVDMLYLTDMSGKIIKEIQMNGADRIKTNLDGLPMGMYFLRYPIGKKWLSGKVLLMR